ncbi:hypothetical protein IAP91_06945 [Leuconostoc mesenteroides]|nr:hypothetical protein [Leuconostoc mesenteroides]
MGLLRLLGNHLKDKTLNQIAGSSGVARDIIRIHQVKKTENSKRIFGVRLEYVSELSEEEVISILDELFGISETETLRYIGQTPITFVSGLNNAEAKETIKILKDVNVEASVVKLR